jgi:uncharacterized repeat protein (TIGR03803 family)
MNWKTVIAEGRISPVKMKRTLVVGFLSFLINTCALPAQSAPNAPGEAAPPTQTFATLANFDGSNCANPHAAFVQGFDGNLYGTTYSGGANNSGTVFKITPTGTLTTLYSFCAQSGCPDGTHPTGGLVQASNGDFYGTTLAGGVNGYGSVFKITLTGTLTTVHSFDATDGVSPAAGLILATNGNFYGTTQYGGVTGYGTVFKMTPSGTLTTLYSFCAQLFCADGYQPYAGLVQATDGNLYGATIYGGGHDNFGYCYDYGCGTVFKITPSGALTTLYRFCAQTNCSDGALVSGGLIQATDGNFYGTTAIGGATGNGTVFKITPSRTLTTLYSFCAQVPCSSASDPVGGLVQATDGNFYGTTYYGGADNPGTVFEMTPEGSLTTLDSIGEGATLIQDTSGAFYGTTTWGGTDDDGTVFTLSVGLAPFVETQPASGKVGASVKILGTNLTGATSVTFNGTAAAFTVVSPSLITTNVPAGATTGEVRVIKPHATVSSNVPFGVAQ